MSTRGAVTHNRFIGYLFWLIGFTGAHRFYYGRQVIFRFQRFKLGMAGGSMAVAWPSPAERARQRFS